MVPNLSEGQHPELYLPFGEILQEAGCLVLDVDPDREHNRTVVTAVAASGEELVEALLAGIASLVDRLNIASHTGLHPRLGVADVVPLVPLGGASLEECVELAQALGQRVWQQLQVPVYFYAAAARREEARRLAAIRSGRLAPDLGSESHPTAGSVCVGARPPLVAYNVVLAGRVGAAEAQGLAARLRESGGGMRGLQAMVFELGDGSQQLSMNLTDLSAVTPARVRAELKKLEVEVVSDEVVGLCPAAAALGSGAAAGRILEGHLAAAAAVAAHRAGDLAGDEEQRLLGQRLLSVANLIGGLRPAREDYLDAAEQAVALVRVLEVAGLLTPQLRSVLLVAADGLRDALGAEVEGRYAERVALLTRGLAELSESP